MNIKLRDKGVVDKKSLEKKKQQKSVKVIKKNTPTLTHIFLIN